MLKILRKITIKQTIRMHLIVFLIEMLLIDVFSEIVFIRIISVSQREKKTTSNNKPMLCSTLGFPSNIYCMKGSS